MVVIVFLFTSTVPFLFLFASEMHSPHPMSIQEAPGDAANLRREGREQRRKGGCFACENERKRKKSKESKRGRRGNTRQRPITKIRPRKTTTTTTTTTRLHTQRNTHHTTPPPIFTGTHSGTSDKELSVACDQERTINRTIATTRIDESG